MNLNYSVQDLLLRYQIALEELSLHYIGNIAEGDASDGAELGVIKYTKEDVEDFYFDSNASRRVLIAYLDEDYFTAARAEEIRDTIASKPDEKSVANYIASFTLGAPTSEIVGKYTYDKFYYSEFTDCAFSLEIGQTGPVITLKTDSFEGYIIVYRAASTAEYFESDYNTIAQTYLYTCFGQILEETAEDLSASKEYTKYLNELDRSAISMQ